MITKKIQDWITFLEKTSKGRKYLKETKNLLLIFEKENLEISRKKSLAYRKEYNRRNYVMQKSREKSKSFRQTPKGNKYFKEYYKKYYLEHKHDGK